jgi:hypothetical protein
MGRLREFDLALTAAVVGFLLAIFAVALAFMSWQ